MRIRSKKNKRLCLLIFAVFHLFVIALSTFISDYSTAKEYFSENEHLKGDDIKKDFLQESIYSILNIPGITPYAIISGTDAGYGFFAPNVASSYIIECVIKNEDGNVLTKKYTPAFKTHEGLLRYETLVSGFQERMKALKKETNKNLYTRFLDIMLRSIGSNMFENCDDPKAKSASVTLYLYSYPMLNKYIAGMREAKLVNLVSFDLAKNQKNLNRPITE